MEKTSGPFPQADLSEIFSDSEGIPGNLDDEIKFLKECLIEATSYIDPEKQLEFVSVVQKKVDYLLDY